MQDASADVQVWHNETTYTYLQGGAVQPGDVLRLLRRPHGCGGDLEQLGEEHGSVVEGDASAPYFWFRLQKDGDPSVFSPCFVRSGNYSAGAIPLPNIRITVKYAPPPPTPPSPSSPPPRPPPPPVPPTSRQDANPDFFESLPLGYLIGMVAIACIILAVCVYKMHRVVMNREIKRKIKELMLSRAQEGGDFVEVEPVARFTKDEMEAAINALTS